MNDGRTIHLKVSITGLLWDAIDKSRLRDLLQTDDGRDMAPREAFDELIAELRKGHLYVKCGDCVGFDPMTGCPGHTTAPKDESAVPA